VSVCFAGQAQVRSIRAWPGPGHTRLVFDIDSPVDYRLFTLENPNRVVLDLRHARLATALPKQKESARFVKRLRASRRNKHDLRLVLDLKVSGVRAKSFQLAPNQQYGHRLVVDLQGVGESDAAPTAARVPAAGAAMVKLAAARVPAAAVLEPKPAEPRAPAVAAVNPRPDTRRTPMTQRRLRDLVIALDPGHGGEDPGASGAHRTREKDIVLAIAKRLKTHVDREPGMRAVLTRTADYYVGLRKRMELARRHGADLFISIHADAFDDPRVNGSAVYILSRNGASSEAARWLAEKENASDLVGGVSLDDKDELLASVLLDLSQTATMSASTEIGSAVLRELRSVGKTHKRHVERAGFLVLKSPDIPSILIEADFISNPKVERKLMNASHQAALADAVVRGVRRYFEHNAPPDSVFAHRRHVISQGDTLVGIASRYGTTVAALRNANKLHRSDIRKGEVLRIPSASGS
jgi:N-acetylmuramoyl-L-alanine amidase